MEADRFHAYRGDSYCPPGYFCDTVDGTTGYCPNGETCGSKFTSVYPSHLACSVISPLPQCASLPSRYLEGIADDILFHISSSWLTRSHLCPMRRIRLLLPPWRHLLAKCKRRLAMRSTDISALHIRSHPFFIAGAERATGTCPSAGSHFHQFTQTERDCWGCGRDT
jgi:hypothetical protein